MKPLRILIVFALFAIACTPTRHDDPLATFMTSTTPTIGTDARGFFYLISEKDEVRASYVILEYDGEREIFFAIPHGRRSVQILPLSSLAPGWLEEQVGQGVRYEFIQSPADARISESLAWWDGTKVHWLNGEQTDTTGVLVDPSLIENAPSFRALLTGTARVGKDVETHDGVLPEQAFFIPDPPDESSPSMIAYHDGRRAFVPRLNQCY